MIRVVDFLPVPNPGLTKVKFNIRAGTGGAAAWDLLLSDDHEEWLNMTRYRDVRPSNNMGEATHVLTFAQYYPYGPQFFMFGGFFKVRALIPEIIGGPGYELELMAQHSEYIKRLVIKLEKPIGQSVYLRWYQSLQGSNLNPQVHELSPDTKLGTFPGYQNLRVRHRDLQRIFANDEPSWKDALSSVKGVYVITDLSSGLLYVGSASGEASGLWQRWSGYANLKNLTGGNQELEALRARLGDSHIVENFQYTILEIFDPKASRETVLKRESFWKLALDSRQHGLNLN